MNDQNERDRPGPGTLDGTFISARWRPGFVRLDNVLTEDIYSLSFLVGEDRSRKPTLSLGYNTVSHWNESISRSSDAGEAKWNYAYWLKNKLAFFGDETDSVVRDAWFAGFVHSRVGKHGRADHSAVESASQQFILIAVSVARQLHQSGVIQNKFGRIAPIIVHELEYYEQIALQAENANPTGVAQEFVDWPAPLLGSSHQGRASVTVGGRRTPQI